MSYVKWNQISSFINSSERNKILSTNLMCPLDLCIFFLTALAKTQGYSGAPRRQCTLQWTSVNLSCYFEMKLIRDMQKVAVHPINEGVPAHETWILYPESKHELLVFQGIVRSTEAPFLCFFFPSNWFNILHHTVSQTNLISIELKISSCCIRQVLEYCWGMIQGITIGYCSNGRVCTYRHVRKTFNTVKKILS